MRGIESELEILKKLMKGGGEEDGEQQEDREKRRRNNQRGKERKSGEGALGYKLLPFVTRRPLTCALSFLASTSFPGGAKGS